MQIEVNAAHHPSSGTADVPFRRFYMLNRNAVARVLADRRAGRATAVDVAVTLAFVAASAAIVACPLACVYLMLGACLRWASARVGVSMPLWFAAALSFPVGWYLDDKLQSLRELWSPLPPGTRTYASLPRGAHFAFVVGGAVVPSAYCKDGDDDYSRVAWHEWCSTAVPTGEKLAISRDRSPEDRVIRLYLPDAWPLSDARIAWAADEHGVFETVREVDLKQLCRSGGGEDDLKAALLESTCGARDDLEILEIVPVGTSPVHRRGGGVYLRLVVKCTSFGRDHAA